MNEAAPNDESSSLQARWRRKFACALRGLAVGVRNQNSFLVHVPASLVVIALGLWLGVTPAQWSILVLCIAIVIAAELFNSALEQLAQAITSEQNPAIRDALDIASGAVLVASLGAAAVGLIVLVWPLAAWLVGS